MNKFSNLTTKCAFCGEEIEPNFYNACEDCYEEAKDNPEKFIKNVLA